MKEDIHHFLSPVLV